MRRRTVAQTTDLKRRRRIIAPCVAPGPILRSSGILQNPANPLPKRDSANAPDRIRTCDLRFRSPRRWVGWTTWSLVSSGFRRIESRWNRLESVGHVAPFVAHEDLLSSERGSVRCRMQSSANRPLADRAAALRTRLLQRKVTASFAPIGRIAPALGLCLAIRPDRTVAPPSFRVRPIAQSARLALLLAALRRLPNTLGT
jgi:hypothetical protein